MSLYEVILVDRINMWVIQIQYMGGLHTNVCNRENTQIEQVS